MTPKPSKKRDFKIALAVGLLGHGLLILVFLLATLNFKQEEEGSAALHVTSFVGEVGETASAQKPKVLLPSEVDFPPHIITISPASLSSAPFHWIPPKQETPFDVFPSFEPSFNVEALQEMADQQHDQAMEAVSSLGSSVTMSGEELKRILPGSRIGNGSDVILFIDVSGSMEIVGKLVNRYVRTRFPKVHTVAVKGCRLEFYSENLIKAFQANSHLDRDKYFFVTDLQDDDAREGLNVARIELLQRGREIEFHVISFDRQPRTGLARLIEETNGSFSLGLPITN